MKFMKGAFGKFHKFSYEVAIHVRFCPSYESFKHSFIAMKVEIISVGNVMLSGTVMMLQASNHVSSNVEAYM